MGAAICGLSHSEPPTADRLHRKSGRIVIAAHTHPTGLTGRIMGSVRFGAPSSRNRKIMHAHLLGAALRTQFAPGVLGVHRKHHAAPVLLARPLKMASKDAHSFPTMVGRRG